MHTSAFDSRHDVGAVKISASLMCIVSDCPGVQAINVKSSFERRQTSNYLEVKKPFTYLQQSMKLPCCAAILSRLGTEWVYLHHCNSQIIGTMWTGSCCPTTRRITELSVKWLHSIKNNVSYTWDLVTTANVTGCFPLCSVSQTEM